MIRRAFAGAGQVALFLIGNDRAMRRFVARALDAQRVDRVRSTSTHDRLKGFRL